MKIKIDKNTEVEINCSKKKINLMRILTKTICYNLARESSDTDLLLILSNSLNSPYIARALANNKCCPIQVLEKIALNNSYHSELCCNSFCPKSILDNLYKIYSEEKEVFSYTDQTGRKRPNYCMLNILLYNKNFDDNNKIEIITKYGKDTFVRTNSYSAQKQTIEKYLQIDKEKLIENANSQEFKQWIVNNLDLL